MCLKTEYFLILFAGQMMKKINWKEHHLKKTKLMTQGQEKEISSPLLIEGLNDTQMC